MQVLRLTFILSHFHKIANPIACVYKGFPANRQKLITFPWIIDSLPISLHICASRTRCTSLSWPFIFLGDCWNFKNVFHPSFAVKQQNQIIFQNWKHEGPKKCDWACWTHTHTQRTSCFSWSYRKYWCAHLLQKYTSSIEALCLKCRWVHHD